MIIKWIKSLFKKVPEIESNNMRLARQVLDMATIFNISINDTLVTLAQMYHSGLVKFQYHHVILTYEECHRLAETTTYTYKEIRRMFMEPSFNKSLERIFGDVSAQVKKGGNA